MIRSQVPRVEETALDYIARCFGLIGHARLAWLHQHPETEEETRKEYSMLLETILGNLRGLVPGNFESRFLQLFKDYPLIVRPFSLDQFFCYRKTELEYVMGTQALGFTTKPSQ